MPEVKQWGMPDAFSVLQERLQSAFDTVLPGADPVLLGFDGLGRSRRAPGSTEPSLRLGFSSAEKRKMRVKCVRRPHDIVLRAARF